MQGPAISFRAEQIGAEVASRDRRKDNAKSPMEIDIELEALAVRARAVGKSLVQSDLERLSMQLQDLDEPPPRRFGQNTLNSVHSNASSGASRNDVETLPELSTSYCSTPSNGEFIPRTPSNLSQLTVNHAGVKALSGTGRPRTSSPLVTGVSSANESNVSSSDRHSSRRLSRPSEEELKRFTTSDGSYSEARRRQRSSSFSAVQHNLYSTEASKLQHNPELATRCRRASLPSVIDQSEALTWFGTSPIHRRDINLPAGIPAYPKRVAPRRPEDEIETIGGAEDAVEDQKCLPQSDEKTSSSDSSKASVWSRAAASIEATYYPSESPPLIMPTGPTDLEKTLYLKTNRLGLYSFGVFSFLSLSVGMWLFVVSSVSSVRGVDGSIYTDTSKSVFYWFGAVVFLLQLYLIISYTVSICGKDYDITKHHRILAENPIDPQGIDCPSIDVYLPCCKEPIEILENTYKHIQQLQWPAGKLKVWVLDDGGSGAVQTLAGSYGYNYICREDRPRLKKAGNLRWAFARTEGDFFAIFDAVSTHPPEIAPWRMVC
ncbi:uncharacterized protein RCC_07424 [Ramularia collo-cygni]|uniref:Uncharacterized protein n=1 Tax=Ramularia collo-cygni TaxID=112498 RepID=A0A2D3V7Z6_9PEZI|nr:uncharacterized protein RCC_07424 [Ramularia collo-cygni]CZT21560.1 uncharacterized protein RCC_07424 [Ramularia collo-cygni]